MIVDHISDENLERYVMRTLPDSELEPLESHLLHCLDCESRLQETEDYISAIRLAIEKLDGGRAHAAKVRTAGAGSSPVTGI